MNIFVLDSNPVKCAMYHCDKHVIKMILESAQMICTTHYVSPNTSISYSIPYKITHINHPCTKWVRNSLSNYKWLLELITSLNDEFKFRYNKTINHKSYDSIKNLPLPNVKDIGLTPWSLAMPDEYKIDNNPIQSYKNYYLNAKSNILKYTNRIPPSFIIYD